MLSWDRHVTFDNKGYWSLNNCWIDEPVEVFEKFKKNGNSKYSFIDFSGKKHKFADRNEAFMFSIEAAVSRLLDIVG